MFDAESDYSSSSEGDEDYIPSGDEESADDLEGLVDEEDVVGGDDDQPAKKTKSKGKGKAKSATRRRKGWSALEEEASKDEDPAADLKKQEDELRGAEAEKKREEERKKKAEDLWSSFMSDVGTKPKPKPKPTTTPNPTTSKAKSRSSAAAPAVQHEKDPETLSSSSNSTANGGKEGGNTIQITQVLDFAGEEVHVVKVVDVTTKEGKQFLKEQEKKTDTTAPSLSSSPLTRGLPTKPGPSSGLKRPGAGLGGVLGQIGKKKKIGTLEKSKLDWESFKSAQGIGEELKIHNKGKEGFVERQRFLQRTDVRQYEKERDMRLTQSKINR